MDFFNNIYGALTSSLGPFGPLILVGTLGVFLILVTIPIMISQSRDPIDKL